MNTSEQLYHLNDTLQYLVEKFNDEVRLIKALHRKIIDKQDRCLHCYVNNRSS